MTVAALQEELSKHRLDTKWNPMKGKTELVNRLQARLGCSSAPHRMPATPQAWRISACQLCPPFSSIPICGSGTGSLLLRAAGCGRAHGPGHAYKETIGSNDAVPPVLRVP